MKNKNLIILGYGFLSWLVPFVISFFFFDKSAGLTIDPALFKSIMIVTGTTTGVYLLVRYFKQLPKSKNYIKEGLVVGLAWFVINCVLDVLTLVYGFQMPLHAWIRGIGLGYLTMPIISTGVGAVLQKK